MENHALGKALPAMLLLAVLAVGCAETDSAGPPRASFTADPVKGGFPLLVQFTDTSTTQGAASRAWDFGDGNTSTETNPLHAYAWAGAFAVSLTVTDEGGSDTCLKGNLIFVYPPLTADFSVSPASGSAPLNVQFTDEAHGFGTITAWAWNFGDGASSAQQNPAHTFTAGGAYTVSLTVTTAEGSDICTKPGCVTVQALNANFIADVTSGAAPLTVTFTDLSTAPDVITSWAWDFGDTGTSTQQDPSHAYSQAGTYTVQLTAQTALDSDSEVKTGYVTVTAPVGKPTLGSGGATGTQTGTYNSRAYKLYVPASYSDSTPTPIVVCMHGLGDTYTNFFSVATYYGWQSSANTRGFIFMVPDHKNATRASFLHFSGTSFDWTATQAEMADLLLCVYYGVGASYNIETTKIYWTGFSEGGTFTDLAAYALSKELRACAPFAGCVSGKQFPLARKIPVYAVCGMLDGSYTAIQGAFQEWVNASHPTKSNWVSGVGHLYSGLLTSGPSADTVYQWMATVTCESVISGLP
jgi:PKD repeat protein